MGKDDANSFGAPLDLESYLWMEDRQDEPLNAFDQGEGERDPEDAAKRALYRADMAKVLSTVEGKRVLLSILERLGLHEQVYRKSADIYAAAALNDVAKGILAEVAWADLEAFKQIQVEGVKRWARSLAAKPRT